MIEEEELELLQTLIDWVHKNTNVPFMKSMEGAYLAGLTCGIEVSKRHPEWAMALVSGPKIKESFAGKDGEDITALVRENPIRIMGEEIATK